MVGRSSLFAPEVEGDEAEAALLIEAAVIMVGVMRLLSMPFGGLSPTSEGSRLRLIAVVLLMEELFGAALTSSSRLALDAASVLLLFALTLAMSSGLGLELALLLLSCKDAATPLESAMAGDAILDNILFSHQGYLFIFPSSFVAVNVGCMAGDCCS